MTLATTCPNCRTSFRVVADQLKLRRGLVRCGRCQRVFSGVDALTYLDDPELTGQPAPESLSSPAPAGASLALLPTSPPWKDPLPSDEPQRLENGSSAIEDGSSAIEAGSSASEQALPSETSVGADAANVDTWVIRPVATPLIARAEDMTDTAAPIGTADQAYPEDQPGKTDETGTADQARPSHPVADADAGAGAEGNQGALPASRDESAPALEHASPRPTADDLLSLRPDHTPDVPLRRRSFLMPALIALGILGVLLQSLIGWRHELAYRLPALQPMVSVLAERLGLDLHPPLDADALTIESFDLRATDAANRLRLDAVLRNRSDRPVAFPAIELTLRDSQSVMLVRRVIPQDSFVSSQDRERGLAAGAEWPLRVELEHDGLAVSGYSAVLFHP